jgi:hypothetical protein
MDSKLILDATLGTLDGSLSFPEIVGNRTRPDEDQGQERARGKKPDAQNFPDRNQRQRHQWQ